MHALRDWHVRSHVAMRIRLWLPCTFAHVTDASERASTRLDCVVWLSHAMSGRSVARHGNVHVSHPKIGSNVTAAIAIAITAGAGTQCKPRIRR